jgi:hypothetical protein
MPKIKFLVRVVPKQLVCLSTIAKNVEKEVPGRSLPFQAVLA